MLSTNLASRQQLIPASPSSPVAWTPSRHRVEASRLCQLSDENTLGRSRQILASFHLQLPLAADESKRGFGLRQLTRLHIQLLDRHLLLVDG